MTHKGTQRGQEQRGERGAKANGADDAGSAGAGWTKVHKESGGLASPGARQANSNGAVPEASSVHEKGKRRSRAERSEAAKRGWSTRRSKDALK